MKWFILAPLNALCAVLCYLTNWLAVLFCDECGELHGVWRYWQTWDDSCDVEWFVKTKVPAFMRYDFDAHYLSARETNATLKSLGRDKGCVIQVNAHWTTKERIQRYLCRLMWLMRNNGYGFAFYVFGCVVDASGLAYVCDGICYEHAKSLWSAAWKVHMKPRIVGKVYADIFLGWKIADEATAPAMAMIANRAVLKFE